ncbi:hypothetical protein ACET79_20095, partial [Aeromonas veronii]
ERSHWSGNGVHVEPESVFMIGRNMQAGQNCYRYREMEIWPHRARLSADNEVICTRASDGRNCYRYREMEIPPPTSSIVG